MRKIVEKNNRRVNYTTLVDLLNNWLDIQEAKNRKIEDILKDVKTNLDNRLCVIPNWKEKHLNRKTISLLDKLIPKDVTVQQIYTLLRKFIEYKMDNTDFRKIQNAYTLLRYYENPKELQLLGTDWKDIMKNKK